MPTGSRGPTAFPTSLVQPSSTAGTRAARTADAVSTRPAYVVPAAPAYTSPAYTAPTDAAPAYSAPLDPVASDGNVDGIAATGDPVVVVTTRPGVKANPVLSSPGAITTVARRGSGKRIGSIDLNQLVLLAAGAGGGLGLLGAAGLFATRRR